MTTIPLQSIRFPGINNKYILPVNEAKVYGAKWNRTSNLMTRTDAAADITTTTTNFCHKGDINPNYDNPFDSIYPWSEMQVVNVDMVKYRSGNYSLKQCIKAVYGDPDFTYFGDNETFVGRYRPPFWYRSTEDTEGNVTFQVSQSPKIGYKFSDESIAGISFCVDAGDSKVTSGAGVPLTNIAVSTIHARAKASGFTLMNIDDLDAEIVLYLVEYANMNCQNAIGDGCSSCYRQNEADAITGVDNSGDVTIFTIDNSAFSAAAYKGAQVSIGASVGAVMYKAIIADVSLSGTVYTITLDRKLDSITTGMYVSVHGFATCEFPYIGKSLGNASGYLGTASKANAFYRGRMLWANRYNYVLGIYRQTNTNHLWICPEGIDPDDYDALNTTVHRDTDTALPDIAAAWCTVGSNAQRIAGLEGFMATGASNGSSASPVGDQQYVPAITAGNAILLAGGSAGIGWSCGLFCGLWGAGSGASRWDSAGSPLLKNPQ